MQDLELPAQVRRMQQLDQRLLHRAETGGLGEQGGGDVVGGVLDEKGLLGLDDRRGKAVADWAQVVERASCAEKTAHWCDSARRRADP